MVMLIEAGGIVGTVQLPRVDGAPAPGDGAGAVGKATVNRPGIQPSELYSGGRPRASDINQGPLGTCYLLASMGALANQRPDVIRDAISYDARSDSFDVRLNIDGEWRTINVTQADIRDNVARQGGSTLDETGRDAPAWPAVIETAAAKAADTNHADGLDQGYAEINGGKARDSMEMLTGDRGEDITFSDGWFESRDAAIDRFAGRIDAALANGRPVTLSTDPESGGWFSDLFGTPAEDGLVDNHVYVVEGVSEVNGEQMVTLRNPWAHNTVEGRNENSPTITVSLRSLIDSGGLEYVNAGPAN